MAEQEQKPQGFSSLKTFEDFFASSTNLTEGRFMLYIPTLDLRNMPQDWHSKYPSKSKINTYLVLESGMFYAGITGEGSGKPEVFGIGWSAYNGQHSEQGFLILPYGSAGETYCLPMFPRSQIQKVDFYIPWRNWTIHKLEGKFVQNGLYQGIIKAPAGLTKEEVGKPWKQLLNVFESVLPEEAILGIETGLSDLEQNRK